MNTEQFSNWCELVYREHKCDPIELHLRPESKNEWAYEKADSDAPLVFNLLRHWPEYVINPVTGENVQIRESKDGLDYFVSRIYLFEDVTLQVQISTPHDA